VYIVKVNSKPLWSLRLSENGRTVKMSGEGEIFVDLNDQYARKYGPGITIRIEGKYLYEEILDDTEIVLDDCSDIGPFDHVDTRRSSMLG